MNPILVSEPLLNGNEKKYLNECIDSGWISSEGPFVDRLEKQFATSVGRRFGIAVSSGTAALDLAVSCLDLGAGDEVILPTFTIISCAAAIVRSGATPVVVDCFPDTWNMNITQVESKITPRTKAIMVVHIYGLPVDMDPILVLAKKYELMVIEDAAEVHGQTYKNRSCGSFGELSLFSFYANKNITTGEGGMILTDDEALADRCRSLRNLCMQSEQRFIHHELGWNYRMSNLQAALGVAQLERIDKLVERKRQIGRHYTALLKDVSCLQLPVVETYYAKNIYWVYSIVLKDEVDIDAKELMRLLREQGIGTRPFFWPMHLQPVFLNMGLFDSTFCPISERISQRGLYLPSGGTLTDQQINRVVDAIKQILSISSKNEQKILEIHLQESA
jgi:perosamine synthetase